MNLIKILIYYTNFIILYNILMDKSLLESTDDSSGEEDIMYRNLNDSKQKYIMIEDFEKYYDLDIDNNNYKLNINILHGVNKIYNCDFYKNKFNNDYYLKALTNIKISKNDVGNMTFQINKGNYNIYNNKFRYKTIDRDKPDLSEVFGDDNIHIYFKRKKNIDYIEIYKVVYKYKSIVSKLNDKYYKN